MFYSKLKSTTSCEIRAARCHGTFGTLRVKFMWLICGILRLAPRSAIIFEKCQRRAEQRRWEINLLCSPSPAPLSTVPASTRAANEPSRSLRCYNHREQRMERWFSIRRRPLSVIVKLQTSRRIVSSSTRRRNCPEKWRSPPSVSVTLAPSPVAAGVCSGTISAAAGGKRNLSVPGSPFLAKIVR